MLEVHAIRRYGLDKHTQVHDLFNFLVNVHGFRVYQQGFNLGWPGARRQIKASLVNAGFPWKPCCWLLQLMRPPWNDTWKYAAAQPASAPSLFGASFPSFGPSSASAQPGMQPFGR